MLRRAIEAERIVKIDNLEPQDDYESHHHSQRGRSFRYTVSHASTSHRRSQSPEHEDISENPFKQIDATDRHRSRDRDNAGRRGGNHRQYVNDRHHSNHHSSRRHPQGNHDYSSALEESPSESEKLPHEDEGSQDEDRCYNCGKHGHYQNQCPRKDSAARESSISRSRSPEISANNVEWDSEYESESEFYSDEMESPDDEDDLYFGSISFELNIDSSTEDNLLNAIDEPIPITIPNSEEKAVTFPRQDTREQKLKGASGTRIIRQHDQHDTATFQILPRESSLGHLREIAVALVEHCADDEIIPDSSEHEHTLHSGVLKGASPAIFLNVGSNTFPHQDPASSFNDTNFRPYSALSLIVIVRPSSFTLYTNSTEGVDSDGVNVTTSNEMDVNKIRQLERRDHYIADHRSLFSCATNVVSIGISKLICEAIEDNQQSDLLTSREFFDSLFSEEVTTFFYSNNVFALL
jgi:hypothetical protein